MLRIKYTFLFLLIFLSVFLFAQSEDQTPIKGDFDFYVTVLDQSKKPISGIEVRLKNEEEELVEKKLSKENGLIEFRGLFKNRSYHVEIDLNHEKTIKAQKIYLKDDFKTEEILKVETGFDYFVFVGDNLSFSELGTRDLRADTPEEIAQKNSKTNNNSTVHSATTEASSIVAEKLTDTQLNSESKSQKNSLSQTDTVVESIAKTSAGSQDQKIESEHIPPTQLKQTEGTNSNNESKNVTVTSAISVNDIQKELNTNSALSKNETAVQNAGNGIENKNTLTESKNKSSSTQEPEKTSIEQSSIIVKENSVDYPSNKLISSNESLNDSKSKENEFSKNETINFSSFKSIDLSDNKNFNLLIEEENKITIKKIEYKVQIGAYHSPEFVQYKQLESIGVVEKQGYPDGMTRITVGKCKSLKEADETRKKLIAKGQKDAWIVGFYENKRYTLKELIDKEFFMKN